MKKLVVALLATVMSPCVAFAGTIQLITADRVQLAADHQGEGERGVVLIHSFHAERTGWGDLPDILEQQGAQVLAIDLRGHGASKGDTTDATSMLKDVEAAVAYLRKHGAKQISLLGAGLGGNLALAVAASDPAITDVVMISPRLDARGVKVSAYLKKYGDRPLLLIASGSDGLSTRAANLIADRNARATVEIVDAAGNGIKLLNRDSSIEGILVSWYNGAYDVTNKAPSLDLQTGSGEQLETTGVKIGER